MKQHNKCLLVLLALGILLSCTQTPRQLVFRHPGRTDRIRKRFYRLD